MAVLTTASTTGGAIGDTTTERPGFVIKQVLADGLYVWDLAPDAAPAPDGSIKTFYVTELPATPPATETMYVVFGNADVALNGMWLYVDGGYFAQ